MPCDKRCITLHLSLLLCASMWRRWHPQSPSPRPGAANPKRKLYSSPGAYTSGSLLTTLQIRCHSLLADSCIPGNASLRPSADLRGSGCEAYHATSLCLFAGAAALGTVPHKRRCGPSDDRPSTANVAAVPGMPTFAGRTTAETPEAMQLDSTAVTAITAQHAACGFGIMTHGGAGQQLMHHRKCGEQALFCGMCDASAECPARGAEWRPPVSDVETGVQVEGQRGAQQQVDVAMQSPFPDALLTAAVVPAMAVRKGSRPGAERVPWEVSQ